MLSAVHHCGSSCIFDMSQATALRIVPFNTNQVRDFISHMKSAITYPIYVELTAHAFRDTTSLWNSPLPKPRYEYEGLVYNVRMWLPNLTASSLLEGPNLAPTLLSHRNRQRWSFGATPRFENLFTADSELHSTLNYIDELRWIPTTNTQGEQTTNMHGEQHYHYGRSAEHMWLLVSSVTRQMSGFSACNTQRWPMRIFALHRSYLRY